MIRKNTVLIVGAGGGIPYGLPSGGDLLSSVISNLQTPNLYSVIDRLTRHDQTQSEAIRKRLTRSMTDSIDAFLEKNPDDQFVQDLGKVSIAYCLWSRLQKARAFAPTPTEDWIKFVWNRMHQESRSFDDLRLNKLTFITFNFDTLLEAKLTQAIVALYPNIKKEDARTYVSSIVVHVHGTLSDPTRTGEPTDEWLGKAKDDIRVVHQEIDKALLSALSKSIDGADVVGFVGFGYHPDNLKKLGFPRSKPDMFGSAFGLGDGEKAQVTRSVGTGYGRFRLGAWDQGCKAFLQNHDVLRS